MVKTTKTGTAQEIADTFRRQIELLEAMPEMLTITVEITTTVHDTVRLEDAAKFYPWKNHPPCVRCGSTQIQATPSESGLCAQCWQHDHGSLDRQIENGRLRVAVRGRE